MFPISKYKFYVTSDNKTIAVTTYAGKTVKGVAKLDPRDGYNKGVGESIAAARCAVKVAGKRYKRAAKQAAKAAEEMSRAFKYFHKMSQYEADAMEQYKEAVRVAKEVEESY